MNENLKVIDDVKPSLTINVGGLNFPLPFFRTKKNISKISVGEILQVDGMPPIYRTDMQKWCERNGHLFIDEKDSLFYGCFFIKKG